MSDFTQIIVILFGSSGIFYIIVKEWLAYQRRRNAHKLNEDEFDAKIKRDSAFFILDYGKEKIKELEDSHTRLLTEIREFRKDFDTLEEKYNTAIKRIEALEAENTHLKKELEDCLGVRNENSTQS